MSTASTIREYVARQLAKLQQNLHEAVTAGDVEAVHDVRVASRRLEEPLEVCRPWLSGKKVSRAIKQLKRTRKAFRDVRELDVLRESIEADANGLTGDTRRQTLGMIDEERGRHCDKARRKVDGDRLQTLVRSLEELLDAFEASPGADGSWVHMRLKTLAGERAVGVLHDDPGEGGQPDLHQTRIGLKKLRYALELTGAITGEDCRDLVKRFKANQDRLGDWNDELEAARHFTRMARRRDAVVERPEWSKALLRHAAERIERAQAIADAFLAEWHAFRLVIHELAGERGGRAAADGANGNGKRVTEQPGRPTCPPDHAELKLNE